MGFAFHIRKTASVQEWIEPATNNPRRHEIKTVRAVILTVLVTKGIRTGQGSNPGTLGKTGWTLSCPSVFLGGAKGIRTPDLLTASQTRSQLRYSPKTQPPYDSITADMISIPKIYFLTAYVRKG